MVGNCLVQLTHKLDIVGAERDLEVCCPILRN